MSDDITLKKSTFNKLIVGIVVAMVSAAFLGGFVLANLGNTQQKENATEDSKPEKTDILESTKPAESNQPSQPTKVFVSLGDDPLRGSSNTPVTVVEFSDFQCPFCARFFSTTLPSIQKEYIDTGKVNFVYRDYPIDRLHPNARTAAVAAECADEQQMFWQYHDELFSRQTEWADLSPDDAAAKFKEIATDLGLNSQFGVCLDSAKYYDEVNEDYLEAVSYGVTGTPTFFIGNDKDGYVKVVGAQAFDVFKQNIDQQLQK